MPERTTDRHRRPGRTQASPAQPRRRANPVIALQRSIGNRAVTQMLARTPTRKGSVEIRGVGTIKVEAGNLEAWAGKETPESVDVTSKTGKHSAKLEKLATERTRTDVMVTITPAHEAGEDLNVGGGTSLKLHSARIKGYAVEDDVEKWRLAGFTEVNRKKETRRIVAG